MSNILHETCGRCGRKLKTAKSMEDGFGPVCKKKWDAEKQQEENAEIMKGIPTEYKI